MTVASVEPEKHAERPFQFGLKQLLLTMAGLSVALAITVPLWRMAQQEARKIQSSNNLRQIAIGLHNYHDVHGSFPSAYIPDSSGGRMHSWRVLIMPFIESAPRYASFDFGKPWNDPANLARAGRNYYFRSPLDFTSPHEMTSYVAIVGPGTMWPGEHGMPISKITDGTSNTIMIVEITNSDIHWMEPRDLSIEELEAWLDPEHKPSLARQVGGGLVVCADASVHVLPPEVTLERLHAMITPAGDEPIGPDELR